LNIPVKESLRENKNIFNFEREISSLLSISTPILMEAKNRQP
jgi:hypothetical protein